MSEESVTLRVELKRSPRPYEFITVDATLTATTEKNPLEAVGELAQDLLQRLEGAVASHVKTQPRYEGGHVEDWLPQGSPIPLGAQSVVPTATPPVAVQPPAAPQPVAPVPPQPQPAAQPAVPVQQLGSPTAAPPPVTPMPTTADPPPAPAPPTALPPQG